MANYTENFPNLSTYNFDKILCQLGQVCGADNSGLINYQFLSRPTTAKDIAQLFYCTYEIMKASKSLQDQFVELYNFIKNFFANLDLQEEVNKWLDEKYKSGELMTFFENFIPYVTPEMYGAKGDGVTDDTDAINQAFASNRYVILTSKKYKALGQLKLSSTVQGNSGCEIEISNPIVLLQNAKIFDVKILALNVNCFDINTSEFEGNTDCNITVERCILNTSQYGIYLYFTENIGLYNIRIKSNDFIGNGISCIAVKLNQTESGLPWISDMLVINNSCIKEAYQYFYNTLPRTTASESWSDIFIQATFEDNNYQYNSSITQYYMLIRGFHRCFISTKTYDFPENKPILYFADNSGSVFIDRIPSAQFLSNFATGVEGFENSILSVGQNVVNKMLLATYDRLPSASVAYNDQRGFFFNQSGYGLGFAISRDAENLGMYMGCDNTGTPFFGVATSLNPTWTEEQIISSNHWLTGGQGQRPTDNVAIGTMYFNQTTKQPIWRYSDGWYNANGVKQFD